MQLLGTWSAACTMCTQSSCLPHRWPSQPVHACRVCLTWCSKAVYATRWCTVRSKRAAKGLEVTLNPESTTPSADLCASLQAPPGHTSPESTLSLKGGTKRISMQGCGCPGKAAASHMCPWTFTDLQICAPKEPCTCVIHCIVFDHSKPAVPSRAPAPTVSRASLAHPATAHPTPHIRPECRADRGGWAQFRRALRRPQRAEREYLAAQYTGTGLKVGPASPRGGYMVAGVVGKGRLQPSLAGLLDTLLPSTDSFV